MLKKKGGEKKVDVLSLPPKKKQRQHTGESSGEKIYTKSPVVSTKGNNNGPSHYLQKKPKESIDNEAVDEIPSAVLTEKQLSSNANDIMKLREDFAKLKDLVSAELKELRLFMLENFKIFMDAINAKHTNEEEFQDTRSKPTSHDPKVQDQSVTTHPDGCEAPLPVTLAPNEAEIKHPDKHRQSELIGGMDTTNSPMGEQHVQATNAIQPESQFELLYELLPSLNPKRICAAKSEDNVYDITPSPIQWNKQSSRWNSSSYSTNCGSSAGGNSSNVIRIHEKKHLLVCDFIQGPYNHDLFEDYANWLREGLYKWHDHKSAGHDAIVRREIHKLVELLPIYVSMYYDINIDDSQDQDIPFDVIYMDDIPQQRYGSMDFGLYLLAYVEHLSEGEGIPVEYFDAEFLQTRCGALYTSKKAEDGVVSDNKAPPKIIRAHVELDSGERIIIN